MIDTEVQGAGTRSVLLERPGAVEGEGVDAGVAAHYGDPMREQRALAAGKAVVDLSNRGVVAVSGPERLSWLNSMTSQALLDVRPGDSRESLVLSPRGHIEFAMHLIDDGETAWLTVERGQAADLTSWLSSMRFMMFVDIKNVSADWAVLGEPSRMAGTRTGPAVWVDPWPGPIGDTALYGPPSDEHPGLHRAWREVLVPRADLATAVGDRELAGMQAAEALRIAAWRPRDIVDTDNRTIPHELDWLATAVHLHKGCYRGQETVARVVNLGRPPRRVIFLHLDGSDHELPPDGAPLFLDDRPDDRPVGRLTRAALHYEDGPIAMGIIKRSVPTDANFIVEGIAAKQTAIMAA